MSLVVLLMVGIIACNKEDTLPATDNTALNQRSIPEIEGLSEFDFESQEFSDLITDLVSAGFDEEKFEYPNLSEGLRALHFEYSESRLLRCLQINATDYLFVSSETEDFFIIKTSEEEDHYSHTLLDLNGDYLATILGNKEVTDSLVFIPFDPFRAPTYNQVVNCINNHLNDICGDNFWTYLTCQAGCFACPECCMAAIAIFAIDCAFTK